MKKKSFILLELLIALGLVSTCILPFLHLPGRFAQRELDALFSLALEETYREMLIEYEISLHSKKVDSTPFFRLDLPKTTEESRVDILLPTCAKRTYTMQRSVRATAQKIGNNGLFYALLHVDHTFTDPKGEKREFHSRFIVEQGPHG